MPIENSEVPQLSQNQGPAQLAWQNRPTRMAQFMGTGDAPPPPQPTPSPAPTTVNAMAPLAGPTMQPQQPQTRLNQIGAEEGRQRRQAAEMNYQARLRAKREADMAAKARSQQVADYWTQRRAGGTRSFAEFQQRQPNTGSNPTPGAPQVLPAPPPQTGGPAPLNNANVPYTMPGQTAAPATQPLLPHVTPTTTPSSYAQPNIAPATPPAVPYLTSFF